MINKSDFINMKRSLLILLSLIPGSFGVLFLGWAINKKWQKRKAINRIKSYAKMLNSENSVVFPNGNMIIISPD